MSTALEHRKKENESIFGKASCILLHQREKSGLTVDNEATGRMKLVNYVVYH